MKILLILSFVKKIFSVLVRVIKWIYDYSGLHFILNKARILDSEKEKKLPTLPIWIIGVYIALFGIASNRYENSTQRIENRVNAVVAQLSTSNENAYKNLIASIPDIQKMKCPIKPYLLNSDSLYLPHIKSVFMSLFIDTLNQDTVDWLKETLVTWKSSLNGVDLSEAILNEADLEHANFRESTLFLANFIESSLSNADFYKADLRNAFFHRATLSNANLEFANLTFAKFQNSSLANTKFHGSKLQSANFSGADLHRANLTRTNLILADFSKAHLREANLFLADIKYTNFSEADLSLAIWIDGTKIPDNSIGYDNMPQKLSEESIYKMKELYKKRMANERLSRERDINKKNFKE